MKIVVKPLAFLLWHAGHAPIVAIDTDVSHSTYVLITHLKNQQRRDHDTETRQAHH